MTTMTSAYEVETPGPGVFVIFQTDEFGAVQTVVLTADQMTDILKDGGHL